MWLLGWCSELLPGCSIHVLDGCEGVVTACGCLGVSMQLLVCFWVVARVLCLSDWGLLNILSSCMLHFCAAARVVFRVLLCSCFCVLGACKNISMWFQWCSRLLLG